MIVLIGNQTLRDSRIWILKLVSSLQTLVFTLELHLRSRYRWPTSILTRTGNKRDFQIAIVLFGLWKCVSSWGQDEAAFYTVMLNIENPTNAIFTENKVLGLHNSPRMWYYITTHAFLVRRLLGDSSMFVADCGSLGGPLFFFFLKLSRSLIPFFGDFWFVWSGKAVLSDSEMKN